MKEIIGFIKLYIREVNKAVLVFCILFTALLVWLNYGYSLEYRLINQANLPVPDISARVIIFMAAFVVPYALLLSWRRKHFSIDGGFFVCLISAPLIFATKAGGDTYFHFSDHLDWNNYWNDIVSWPLRLIIVMATLFFVWKSFHSNETFYGLSGRKVSFKPYLLMLLIMVPLISVASMQPDFLEAYPKLKNILPLPENAHPAWWYKLLFELSYGSDFLSIETFFRGFLVIGFARWVGKDAILPMACFYCTIHFGKPLGECISSFFGGLLLGLVSYHTRSVFGGLIVHLGIAWLMELGGFLGNHYKW